MYPQLADSFDWTRPVRVDASSDPDEATAQTIAIMCGHIRNAASDGLVQAVAAEALTQFSVLAFGIGGQDKQRRIAESCWWWCKQNIKFVHHESLLRQYLGERGHLQGLIAPDILIRMERPQGDCAIFTEMLCSLLRVAGVPYEILTVAVNRSEPEIFSHVYPRAILKDGRRLPLDASHGTYPGWQVPSSDVTRVQVWDEAGNAVADRGSRFDGLHNYGLRGPGDCIAVDSDGVCTEWDTTSATGGNCPGSPGCPGYTAPVALDYTYTGTPAAPVTFIAPSQNSAQWASFATALVKQGFTLAEINAIQPGTSVTAGGIMRQNPGYAVGQPTGALNIGTGGLSPLMLGGLVLGGFVVMSMGKK